MSRVSMTAPQAMHNECWVDGRRVKLSPSECRMLAILLITPPGYIVDHDVLIDAIWPNPDNQPLDTLKIISILKWRLRNKGLNVRGAGNLRTWSIPEDERGGRPERQPRVPVFTNEPGWYSRRIAA